ncbi:peptidase [Clostridium polyendosporum]|uniref:Peptidase n=1 Tax=Clostridium polyendosporum TaxID=69208 RepID=A0A919S093_9CLOT|nr:VWA-like domain-containing protein [Clostridium polyendosporum]GIM29452.1 peptidase [Clostridium polyendosporum]
MNFDGRRRELLREAVQWESPSQVTEKFKREFWELLEYIIIIMLEKEDNFFGQFMVQVKREIKLDISWPIATKPEMGNFQMLFNPVLFLQCELKEMQALFKHEIYHIMLGHYERERILINKYSRLALSIAMDISVNQFIKNLPAWCKKLYTVNVEYNLDLREDMTMEYYAEEIQKAINKIIKNDTTTKDNNLSIIKEIALESAHDSWNSGELSLDNLKEIKKKTALNAYKGKAPKNLENIIFAFNEKPEVQWNEYLKKLIPSVRRGYKKTITRKDRRQPERLDLRGKLPSIIPEIVVAIDISASMSDDEVNKIMIEILGISKSNMANITVVECDNEIRRVYELKSPMDIKKRLQKNGSTSFSPVFKYMRENNMRNHILIYFTDGVGEEELKIRPINQKILWVLTGQENLSLKNPFGEIKRLTRKEKENYGYDYGLQAMRDVIHDWAR